MCFFRLTIFRMILGPGRLSSSEKGTATSQEPIRIAAQDAGVERDCACTQLGGSWVVLSGVRSPLIWVISIVALLITLLITTHEPPSNPMRFRRSLYQVSAGLLMLASHFIIFLYCPERRLRIRDSLACISSSISEQHVERRT